MDIVEDKMGFFSKVFKSVGKVFKKIGKGIKSAFKKFGKFMNKIGILGQIAMMFILPAVGSALIGQTATAAAASASATASAAATAAGASASAAAAAGASAAAAATGSGLLGGALGSVGVAAGKAAVWVGNKIATVKNVFSNITSGVVDTLGNFAKTATNKLANSIGMDNVFTDAAKNFFGTDSAFSRSFGKDSKFQSLTTDFSKLDAVDETTNVGTEKIPTEKALSGDEGFKTVSYEDVSKPKYDVTTALSPDEISKINSMSSENFKSLGFKTTGEVGDIVYKFGDNEMFINTESLHKLGEIGLDRILEPFQTGEEYQKQSLLARATDTIVSGVKSIPEKGIQEAKSFFDDPFGNLGDKATAGLQTRALQTLGLEDKPMAPVYNQYASYVPQFETASQGAYGAPEIMDARAFEQQVTNNVNPYGYTAFQYNQYMSQYGTNTTA